MARREIMNLQCGIDFFPLLELFFAALLLSMAGEVTNATSDFGMSFRCMGMLSEKIADKICGRKGVEIGIFMCVLEFFNV